MTKKSNNLHLSKIDVTKILEDPNSAQVKYRPVVHDGYRPIPNTSSSTYDSDKEWWTEQTRRCIQGWIAPDGVYINPIYYFFLNFVYVDIFNELSKKKEWTRPYFRDGDKHYFDTVWQNMSKVVGSNFINAKDTIVAKGRRKGWSTSEWGIEVWWIIFRQEWNTLRAYPTDEHRNKERPILEKMYESIHPFFKMNEDNIELSLIKKNKDNLVQGYKVGNVEIPLNKVMLTVVDAKGSGARGESIEKITVIEAGMHTKLSTFIGASQDTLRQGLYKFGMILVGGTSDSINNKTTDYKTLFFNAKKNNFKAIFTAANVCFQGCIDYYTGESDKRKAEQIIKAQRKDKSHDQAALKMFIQENPLNVYESFIPSTESEYDKDAIDEQMLYIYEHNYDDRWIRGKFEMMADIDGNPMDTVKFVPDPSGLWYILDGVGLPDYSIENLYVGGIDDVYKDKAPHSESLNAMVIYKRETTFSDDVDDLPVCFYLGRHNSRVTDWREFEKAIKFYKNIKVMYEHNESQGFIGYAREAGIIDKFLYTKGEIGIRLSDQSVSDMTVQAIKYIEAGRLKRVLHSSLVDSFNRWRAENDDLASAFHLVLIALKMLKGLGTDKDYSTERYNHYYTDNGSGFGPQSNGVAPVAPFKFGRN